MSTDKQNEQVEALAKAELWLSFATDDYESRVNSKVIAGELARLRALLTAQPGPVACEPLTGDELAAVIADWLSQPPDTCQRTELARMGAEAQRAKCRRQAAQPATTAPCAQRMHFGQSCGPDCMHAPTTCGAVISASQDVRCHLDKHGLDVEHSGYKQHAPTAPAKTATPALDAYLDSWSSNVSSGFVAKCKGLAASDTAGLCAELEAAKAELAEAKRQRDEKLSNDSGEWLREYQAACARERGLVAENEKLAASLREARRHGREDENAVHTAKE